MRLFKPLKLLYLFCHPTLGCRLRKDFFSYLKSILRRLGLFPPLRILYLSCHSVLEHDETNLLRELGFHIFSPGDYVDKENPGNPNLRTNSRKPTIRENLDLEAFYSFGDFGPENKNKLTHSFISRFDVIIVMHMPQWIILNWDVIKHKTVIWRTIGQSNKQIEDSLLPYRQQGLKIVRYSPLEKNITNYLGEDAIIRFYKNPEEYFGWNGNIKAVMTISQNMNKRFDACHFDIYKGVTASFKSMLFGTGNDDSNLPHSEEVSNGELIKAMQEFRCYLYTGTYPASYTLGFIEAWMTGIPIIAIGQKLMHDRFPDEGLYEVPSLIENGKNGFHANSVIELQNIIATLISNHSLAQQISDAGRSTAIKLFGKETIKSHWKLFLDKF